VIQEVRFARLNRDEGTLDMEHLKGLVDEDTRVVAVAVASNVLGTKSPLKEIGKIPREVNAYFVVDSVHHIAHGPIDVQAVDFDFLAFSGYKIFSSHGSFLYGKGEHLKALQPYKVAPEYPPCKWEWGTRDQSMFTAICGAVDHLNWLASQVDDRYENQFVGYPARVRSLKVAMDAIEKYGRELSRAMLAGFDYVPGLLQMPHVNVYGLKDLSRLEERDPTFAFKVRGIPDEEVEHIWAKYGIALRSENYYSRVWRSIMSPA